MESEQTSINLKAHMADHITEIDLSPKIALPQQKECQENI